MLDMPEIGILNIIRRNCRGGFSPMIPDKILNVFNRSIKMVCNNIACYCSDPASDFTRKRKLPVETLIHFIIQMLSKSLNSELCEYFNDINSLPTTSALCQQRDKLDNYKTWKGFHILACDGSDVNIAYDEKDEDTKRQNGNNKPFSQLHINGLYDCINHVFWDTSIDTAAKTRECAALMEMIMKHNYPINSIITADRGYEKYNLMACCIENNQKFLIRTKDINVYSSILSNLNLPDEEFDLNVTKILTRTQTNETKANKQKYTFISNKSEFNYFGTKEFYKMNLRVVRFKITDDTYECLVTNLTRDEFDLTELKKMYHMRWDIETAFKVLKYIIGMISFHSKKRNFIQQEIYSAILLHCLTNIIADRIQIEQSDRRKHKYKVNISTAVTNMRLWLRKLIGTAELMKRIKKYLAPVRPDRKYQRNMKPKSVVPFNTKAS